MEVVRYGDPLAVEVGLTDKALGSFLPRAFEVLGARPDLAAKLPQITGVPLSASGLGHLAAAVVRFEVIEPEKRPVMADADSRHSLRDVISVEIRSEPRVRHRILFDPGHGLEERLTREQFE